MREIKFRAWDQETGVMVSPDLVGQTPLEDALIDGILMQCTGFRDNSGVEIYEGDVIKWHYMSEATGVVAYSETYAAYAPFCQLQLARVARTIEVIGNIYENPQLVEGAA